MTTKNIHKWQHSIVSSIQQPQYVSHTQRRSWSKFVQWSKTQLPKVTRYNIVVITKHHNWISMEQLPSLLHHHIHLPRHRPQQRNHAKNSWFCEYLPSSEGMFCLKFNWVDVNASSSLVGGFNSQNESDTANVARQNSFQGWQDATISRFNQNVSFPGWRPWEKKRSREIMRESWLTHKIE